MIFYVDTSVLVAALTNEARTAVVQEWLSRQKRDPLAISEWVVTEFSAALSIKLRTGQIQADHRADALAAFARLTAESLQMLPVLPTHFRTAARFADQQALLLRSGDALHLAVAAEHGATLYTLDERLAHAGPALGIRTRLL